MPVHGRGHRPQKWLGVPRNRRLIQLCRLFVWSFGQGANQGFHELPEGLLIFCGHHGERVQFPQFRVAAEHPHGKAVREEFAGDGSDASYRSGRERTVPQTPERPAVSRAISPVRRTLRTWPSSWRSMLSGEECLSRRMCIRKISQTATLSSNK